MAQLEIDNMEYSSDALAQAFYVSSDSVNLSAFSESTIKTQGDYSLKGVASTSALDATLTKYFTIANDLTNVKDLKFNIRSSRTGSNIKLGLYSGAPPTGGTITTDLSGNTIHTFTTDGTFSTSKQLSADVLVVAGGGGGGQGAGNPGNCGGGGAGGLIYTPSNLVSHYKMNDNAANTTVVDSMGINNGTSTANTNTLSVSGKINTALNFNGSTIINIGNPVSLQLQFFTALAWIKPAPTCNGFVFSHSDYPNSAGWGLFYNAGTGNIYVDNAGIAAPINLNNIYLADGNWHLIGIYRDVLNNIGLIVDGVVISASFYSATFSFGSLRIGARFNASIFTGVIDDVRFYNRALTQSEIDAIYNEGNGTENIIDYIIPVGNYSVTVGDGGVPSNKGEDSVFNNLVAIGGGKGGIYSTGTGGGGGSGGGAGQGTLLAVEGGTGTAGQGYDGGDGKRQSNPLYASYGGGGGGGASEVGYNPQDVTSYGENGGNGGKGREISITGTPTYYAGGGGGSTHGSGTIQSIGGLGGGGRGSFNSVATSGTNNLGGGGGGGGENRAGGSGGSGIIILKFPIITSTLITEITPNIVTADEWQTIRWNIANIANIDKSAIDMIKITIANADDGNTFYIDNFNVFPQTYDVVGVIE